RWRLNGSIEASGCSVSAVSAQTADFLVVLCFDVPARWCSQRRIAMNGKRLAAEAIGTFWLTFGGCGSAVISAGFPQVGIGLLGEALAFGLTVRSEEHTSALQSH